MRLLVIEDDDHVAEPLVDGLRMHGYDVVRASGGLEGLRLAGDADLVRLDLGLPDLDGTEVCRRLRQTSQVPIIAVTARSEELDRVIGLQLGADDYVVKPYGFRELVARIQAVARRSAAPQPPSGATEVPSAAVPLKCGGPQVAPGGRLELDPRTRKVVLDGADVRLTRKEFDLLAYLMSDPGAVFSRERLLEDVWDAHWFGSTRTLDVHVAAIRAKLGDGGWIETVRGVGYRLAAPVGNRPATAVRG